ncbi:MAG: hypothetical protein ACI9N1_003261 [Flavobacteriales bacterium]|jgi:hypothetical protein
MKAGSFLLLLALLCSNDRVSSQCEGDNFTNHIQYSIGEEMVSNNAHMEYFTTYLGVFKLTGTDIEYHVIRQFYTVEMANSKRGESRIIIYDEALEKLWITHFDMPYEMPKAIFLDFWVYEAEGSVTLDFFNWQKSEWIYLCTPISGCEETYEYSWMEYKEDAYDGYSFYPDIEFDDTLAFDYSKQLEKLKELFYEDNDPSGMDVDSLIDVNFDGELDYVIRYYGCCGTGIKNRMQVFYRNKKLGKFEYVEELNLMNPSFSYDRKHIYWFYLANGTGDMGELKWNGRKWIKVYSYFADNEGEETVWHKLDENDKLIKEIAMPYQGVPPEELLPMGNYW